MEGYGRTSMVKKLTPTLLFVAAVISIGLNMVPAFATTPGKWVGAADFGTFDLVVNAEGTGVEQISYDFSNFNCGSTTLTQGVLVTPSRPWPISNGSFNIINSLNPDRIIAVSGVFEPEFRDAGTWEADIDGEECSGTWFWQTALEGEDPGGLSIDHAFVQGVYWNPEEFPGWGFFVDIQEDTLFAAIFGYMGSDSTFITLQGTRDSTDPLIFQGDVIFVTGGGSTPSDVGNFTWTIADHEASPAAILTITSNILNVSNLDLVRFSYAEIDKVDMLTGANWNIIRRVSGVTFGDLYALNDTRFVSDGITYSRIVDVADVNKTGVVGYLPADGTEEGDVYVMIVAFDLVTDVYYAFRATNANMYGRYWLLDPGEEPSGSGSYFRGSVDTFQAVDTNSSGGEGITAKPGEAAWSFSSEDSTVNAAMISARKELEELEYNKVEEKLEPRFSPALIKSAFEKLVRARQTIDKQSQ